MVLSQTTVIPVGSLDRLHSLKLNENRIKELCLTMPYFELYAPNSSDSSKDIEQVQVAALYDKILLPSKVTLAGEQSSLVSSFDFSRI